MDQMEKISAFQQFRGKKKAVLAKLCEAVRGAAHPDADPLRGRIRRHDLRALCRLCRLQRDSREGQGHCPRHWHGSWLFREVLF